MNLGMTEMLLIAGIALLFFGPSRLPGLGKSVGQAIRGFKKGITEDNNDDEKEAAPAQVSHDGKTTEQKQETTDKHRQS